MINVVFTVELCQSNYSRKAHTRIWFLNICFADYNSFRVKNRILISPFFREPLISLFVVFSDRFSFTSIVCRTERESNSQNLLRISNSFDVLVFWIHWIAIVSYIFSINQSFDTLSKHWSQSSVWCQSFVVQALSRTQFSFSTSFAQTFLDISQNHWMRAIISRTIN